MQDCHPDTTDPPAWQILEGRGREEAGPLCCTTGTDGHAPGWAIAGPSLRVQGDSALRSLPALVATAFECGQKFVKTNKDQERIRRTETLGRQQLPSESRRHSALPGPTCGTHSPVLVRGVPVRCPPRVEEDGGGQAFMPGSVTSWKPCKLPQPSTSLPFPSCQKGGTICTNLPQQ